MYRALKGFYLTPANLDYEDWRRPGNEFTLTLGHGATMEDVVYNLEPGMTKLGEGVVVYIGEDDVLVKAFPILLTGDMP
jgi:hypothetical protein